jgi:hypothetical protein
MFVSSSSFSKSRSFRFVPPAVVAIETTESAGETAPGRSNLEDGAADGALALEGLGGGRILLFRGGATIAGRGSPAIQLLKVC